MNREQLTCVDIEWMTQAEVCNHALRFDTELRTRRILMAIEHSLRIPELRSLPKGLLTIGQHADAIFVAARRLPGIIKAVAVLDTNQNKPVVIQEGINLPFLQIHVREPKSGNTSTSTWEEAFHTLARWFHRELARCIAPTRIHA